MTFLRSLATFEVEAPIGDEWAVIAAVVERYADFPLGGTEASVAVLARGVDNRRDSVSTHESAAFGVDRGGSAIPA